MALHLPDYLLLYGPVHSWWTFPFERLIHVPFSYVGWGAGMDLQRCAVTEIDLFLKKTYRQDNMPRNSACES